MPIIKKKKKTALPRYPSLGSFDIGD